MRAGGPEGSAAAAPAPYRAILEHGELELELAGRGDIDGLSALASRWEKLTQGLPDPAPAAARPLLEHAGLIHERARIELIRLREALLADVAKSSRARRAADGYAGQLP